MCFYIEDFQIKFTLFYNSNQETKKVSRGHVAVWGKKSVCHIQFVHIVSLTLNLKLTI